MKKLLYPIVCTCIITSCQSIKTDNSLIITSDIENFWKAFDRINSTQDSSLQLKYMDSLYFNKGTVGLSAMREVRNYTAQDYIEAIRSYPKFWESVRANTLKAEQFIPELREGIEKFEKIYPDMKPAKIYFTIGALRSPGTTMDSLVLIGSELAMTDSTTVSSELPEEVRENRRQLFNNNPIDDLVLLNVHEYVHTQQKPANNNLLSYVLREGIAEFVSVKAMGVPSSTPAVEYGKQNDAVRQKFEEEMYYGNNWNEWLWSDAPNDFGVRDLGYYIGYQIAENYYEQSAQKDIAIKELIELDYTNEKEVENVVESSGLFSASLDTLYSRYQEKRPTVLGIKAIENNGQSISPNTNEITVEFSEAMNPEFRNFDFGPLGESAVIRIKSIVGWSEDGRSLTFEIEPLEPNKQYQLTIDRGFRNLENVPLKSFLIDFKTAAE